MRPSLFLAAALSAAAADPHAVRVEIFEDLAKGQEFTVSESARTTDYTEPAFAFVRIPTKYSGEALALDRSSPFVLRATYRRAIAPGQYRFRLRARGAAALFIDGAEVARTKAQKPNTSGDDPVPEPGVIDKSGHRPPPHPHQDAFADFTADGKPHEFELKAVVGGKGLMPTPGELAVSFGKPGEIERLLGPDGSPRLIDSDWEQFVAAQQQRHFAADRNRRRDASKEIAARWRERHEQVRKFYEERAVAVPAAEAGMPAYNAIDHFLNAHMKEASVSPRPLTSDLEFLRRLSLDTIGLVPTPAEIAAYLKEPAAKRRANAIKRLLSHEGWADNWVAYWQDVLAENPGILKPDLNNTGPFRYWIHQSFTDGVPFDRFVTELVQMEGSIHQGAPAAFSQATLNDAPMAAKADIVAQAFLGQKLGCARCHDAPFHPFKQKDLFSLGAMLAGKPMKLPVTSTVPLAEGRRKPAVNITLKAGASIDPEWPFASLIEHNQTGALPTLGKVDTRRQLAALIVAPENQRFAEVVVNRVWKRYMGVGFVEPVDDWSRSKPSHPELMKYLAREFVLSGYDLKALAQSIFESHAYQRKAIEELADTQVAAKNRNFAGPLRRKMSAEQLVDSLHLSVGKKFECEELNLNPAGDRAPSQFLNMGKPQRAWQLTALSNERDRPALALPIAQSLVDVMSAYGWRQSRQSPASSRDDASSPMQTLILANGILGTRLVRLSDDSIFTELALKNLPVEKLIEEAFLRILSRPPDAEETRTFATLLKPYWGARVVPGAKAEYKEATSDNRVSWSNHLSAEATLIRMEEERKLRMGAEPTKRLKPEFRERFEDVLWAMVNSPEFVLMP
ncbi:MAG: DUF1553 domain-containing protein [Bryobacteraceae bacterium]